MLLGKLEELPKNPYLCYKVDKNQKKGHPSSNKQNPILLVGAKTRKNGLLFIFETQDTFFLCCSGLTPSLFFSFSLTEDINVAQIESVG